MQHHHHIKNLMFSVRPRSTDIAIINEVIARDCYKITNHIHRGDVVIDIGAHIGSFAIYAASLGATKILAFEPASINFALLESNISLSEYNIDAYRLGIMASQGKSTLHIRSGNFGGCSFFGREKAVEEVEVITLQDVFETYGIERCDFLKIDCEGAELEIVKGFPYFSRVHRIALEYVGDEARDRIMSSLRKEGYKVTLRANERMGYIHAKRIEDEVAV